MGKLTSKKFELIIEQMFTIDFINKKYFTDKCMFF